MAPNKSDDKIKNLFDNRQIEPSAQAWDRLDAMLTVAENKKQPKTKFWLGIAASFLVLFGLGMFYLQKNNNSNEFNKPNTTNEVVDIDTSKTENTSVQKSVNKNNIAPLKLLSPQEKLKRKIANPYKSIKNTGLAQQKTEDKIDSNVMPTENSQKLATNIPETKQEIKITQNSLVATQNTVASTNVAEYKYKRKPITVNPNDLLETADKELNQTFKERAWKRIQKVSVAFANRNNE
jgi:hypothetical protein